MIQIVDNSAELFSFAFDCSAMRAMMNQVEMRGERLQILQRGRIVKFLANEEMVDIGFIANLVAGKKIVPDITDRRYQYHLATFDSMADIFMVFLFNDRERFSEYPAYIEARSNVLATYFKSLELSKKETVFRQFETRVNSYIKTVTEEYSTCTELYNKLAKGKPVGENLIRKLEFLGADLQDDLRNLANSDLLPLLLDEVQDLCEVKKDIVNYEAAAYKQILLTKADLFTNLMYKKYNTLNEAIEDAYLFKIENVEYSAIYEVQNQSYLVIKSTNADHWQMEYLFKPINELFIAWLGEHGMKRIEDAVKVVQQHKL